MAEEYRRIWESKRTPLVNNHKLLVQVSNPVKPLTRKKENMEPLSSCCKAPVKVDGDKDEGTMFYRCSSCLKPTDILIRKNNSIKSKYTLLSRYKISNSKIEEKNPMWKGNNVGYCALHDWVKRRIFKPNLCENCNKHKPLDLANISGKYKRDLSDWKWLCRICHMKSDGRIYNLIKANKNKTLKDKKCLVCFKNYHPKRISSIFCSKSCHRKYANLNRKGTFYE